MAKHKAPAEEHKTYKYELMQGKHSDREGPRALDDDGNETGRPAPRYFMPGDTFETKKDLHTLFDLASQDKPKFRPLGDDAAVKYPLAEHAEHKREALVTPQQDLIPPPIRTGKGVVEQGTPEAQKHLDHQAKEAEKLAKEQAAKEAAEQEAAKQQQQQPHRPGGGRGVHRPS